MTWAKRSKFGNRKSIDTAGRSFDSGLERSVFAILELQRRAGEIDKIQQQDTVRLSAAGIIYKPDFKIWPVLGDIYWVEAKGFETPEWRLKRRLWKAYGPGSLVIYKGTAARPFIHEAIIPKAEAE